MKVAFLGDFSGLFKNLKEGLIEENHKAIILATGDGFKKIKNDVDLSVHGRFKAVKRLYIYFKNVYNLKGYDVVQIINPEFFKLRYIIFTKIIFNRVKRNNKKVFLSCAGDDYLYIKNCDNFRYSPYNEINYEDRPHISKISKDINYYIAERVDGIIPNLYEYAEAYRYFKNIKKTLPMPININNIEYSKNIAKDKIIIFHGLNREELKGTKYILDALERIEKKYKNKVEIIVDGKMPLNKYLDLMKKTNIVIDQCKSYGYGMNALYSMAMGKVVLSGAEEETLKEFGVNDCPIINILPNSDDIFNKLEYLIINSEKIRCIGYKSRKYVEKIHDYRKISTEYIKIWNN